MWLKHYDPGVPTIYVAIINHPEVSEYNLKSIRACICSAPSGCGDQRKGAAQVPNRQSPAPGIGGRGRSQARKSPIVAN